MQSLVHSLLPCACGLSRIHQELEMPGPARRSPLGLPPPTLPPAARRLLLPPPLHPNPRAEGKPIPTELRKEEAELRHQVGLEDDNTAVPRTHIDDEYAHAGERDAKLLITTSRDPSSRLVQFAKEVKLLFPNAQRVNRGSMVRRAGLS